MTDKQIIIDENKFEKAENEPINQEAVNKFIEDTNKFYIDGVDVSECGFYHSVTGTECHIALAFAEEYTDNDHTYLKCEQNPNCYYKQLKRKEQECEELKEENKEIRKYQYEQDFLQQQLDQLKADNDELKKCYKNNSTLLDFEETNTTKT